jgi:hypothetical protein
VSASVRWDGLDELRAALRALPAELTDEARSIVDQAATDAMSAMRGEYPEGELQNGLTRSWLAGSVAGVAILIKNRSGWAWLWDHGSKLRHRSRSGGSTGAEWGGTTPPHTFGRNMAQYRRRMYEDLKALLTRHGLLVSGDA